MSVYYRTTGFMLSKYDVREADQIFNIYTKDFGSLKVLAKSIRKIKSKLRPGIETFYLSEIEFIQGRVYKTLTDVREIVYQIRELTESLIYKQEKDEEIFNLLNETFNRLNNCKLNPADNERDLKIYYYYFLWNLLAILGYKIDFYNCFFCQKKLLPEKLYFSPACSGITCSQCIEKIKESQNISPEVIKILRIFLKRDWITLLKLRITESYQRSLKSISQNYLNFVKS